MLSLIVSALLFAQMPEAMGQTMELPGYDIPEPRVMLFRTGERLPEFKISPKHKWPFEWVTAGLGRKNPQSPNFELRLRVFAQLKKEKNDPSLPVCRMAMRLWELNVSKLGLDHAYQYNNRIVDIYLCWGGPPGGEQLFDKDVENGIERKVNTIYIYDMPSLTKPLELAREVAHEYGHATLPAVGGFSAPENWANGSLGERLYLTWIRNQMRLKRLQPEDAAGATLEEIDAWVKQRVDPLVDRAALDGPRLSLLAQDSEEAFYAYIGLALYAFQTLPADAFGDSLKLTGSSRAVDYPSAIIAAVEKRAPFSFTVPPSVVGKPIWIPLGMCTIKGAKTLSKAKGWAKVVPSGSRIHYQAPKESS